VAVEVRELGLAAVPWASLDSPRNNQSALRHQ